MNSINRLKNVHPIPVLSFPVTKTGSYFNQAANDYEFWFFMNGKAALCGRCKRSESPPIIITWRAVTLAGLQDLVRQRIADGTLKVDPLVLQGLGTKPGAQ